MTKCYCMEKLPTRTVEKSAFYLEIDKHRGIYMAGCRRMAKVLSNTLWNICSILKGWGRYWYQVIIIVKIQMQNLDDLLPLM